MAESESDEDIIEATSRLARHGVSLLINNRCEEAIELFRSHPESTEMSAGYSFLLFMDALCTFEDEKVNLAFNTLRETEKKCATDIGWMKSFRTRADKNKIKLAERLENQIILADLQLCVAILTFLQEDFSGYIKGGWTLRKAYRIYCQTYNEIVELYKKKIGTFNLPDPTDFEWRDATVPSTSTSTSTITVGSVGTSDWSIPNSNLPSSSSPISKSNGYVPISSPIQKQSLPHSQSVFVFSKGSGYLPFSIKRSDSDHSALTQDHVNARVPNSQSAFSVFTSNLSYLASSLNFLAPSDSNPEDIQPETIVRLMAAVCFGYGTLQLGLSLLPPSILKVTNFLGFSGNRTTGISNLMYSRNGTDMRSPLATLVLLWYHTIVRPYFALDGHNLKAGLESASLLLRESRREYGSSAIFLCFEGRIHRLDSNIVLALDSYKAAADNSTQREIKVLSLNEAAWCYLIMLDYEPAKKTFNELRHCSRWSGTFYLFLTTLCSGACNKLEFSTLKALTDVAQITTTRKTTQLDLYIQRRIRLFPKCEVSLKKTVNLYWTFFLYELLYFWNNLPNCSLANLNKIIHDCNDATHEPMPGLAMLIQGTCYNILSNQEPAIESLRNCIQIRNQTRPDDDLHISAYGEYSLGVILVKNMKTKEEGKSLLTHAASTYKNYDFDNKLIVRIELALKNVS